jgi:hypothetical protein
VNQFSFDVGSTVDYDLPDAIAAASMSGWLAGESGVDSWSGVGTREPDEAAYGVVERQDFHEALVGEPPASHAEDSTIATEAATAPLAFGASRGLDLSPIGLCGLAWPPWRPHGRKYPFV